MRGLGLIDVLYAVRLVPKPSVEKRRMPSSIVPIPQAGKERFT